MKRLPLPNWVARRGARFEKTVRFLKEATVVDGSHPNLDYAGVVMTRVDESTFATVSDEHHTFIIGETGCGKTRRVILPTIRLLAKTGRSMVISDPKGELYKKTACALRVHGYSVRILNFRTPRRGHKWNPLNLAETLYRNTLEDDRDRAVMMLSEVADILATSVQSEKDMFWEQAAKKVFLGLALLIAEHGERDSLTFENISVLSKEFFAELNDSRRTSALKSYITSLPKNSPVVANLLDITTLPSDTRKSVAGVFEAMIARYVNQSSLLDLFSSSDIDVDELGVKPTALFFILPDDTEVMYPIATVFVKQIYSSLISIADATQDGKLRNGVSFILDEFANFARIPAAASMLTAARSRGITFALVCQSMEQLFEKYGQSGAEIIMSNCRVWMYMSCRNLPFLQRLQTLIGDYVSPYTNESHPLISVGDLQHFEIGQVLVLNDRCHPIIGNLPDYSQYDFGEGEQEAPLPDERLSHPRRIINSAELVARAQKNIGLESLDDRQTEMLELFRPDASVKQSRENTICALEVSQRINAKLEQLEREAREKSEEAGKERKNEQGNKAPDTQDSEE